MTTSSRYEPRVLLSALLSIAAAAGVLAQEPTAAPNTVLRGVFTGLQAGRGQQTFQRVCAACHSVAEHSGPRFIDKWGGASVGELFDTVSATMPKGDPGSLTPQAYVDVVAFLLKETGYPEGERELPTVSSQLAEIRIVPLHRQ